MRLPWIKRKGIVLSWDARSNHGVYHVFQRRPRQWYATIDPGPSPLANLHFRSGTEARKWCDREDARRARMKPRRQRPIDRLRAVYPGRWTYEAGEIAPWVHESGRAVAACAVLDGFEDSFRTEYRWLDSGELALGCLLDLLAGR